jgi:hypothetical protein
MLYPEPKSLAEREADHGGDSILSRDGCWRLYADGTRESTNDSLKMWYTPPDPIAELKAQRWFLEEKLSFLRDQRDAHESDVNQRAAWAVKYSNMPEPGPEAVAIKKQFADQIRNVLGRLAAIDKALHPRDAVSHAHDQQQSERLQRLNKLQHDLVNTDTP